MVPESLEGKAKIQTYKSLESFSYEEAIKYLCVEKGYTSAMAQVVTDSIFIEHGLN